ncbi:MAG: DUF3795 domain-containing protein [Deltaproteobacteria bacterium]|nr:DUF3795 domain-containing protein [Deltaproteobacteria bacterium]
MKDKELTAYCGLYCGDCIRFKCRASDLSALLLDELEKSRFQEYSKVKRRYIKELEHYEYMITVLKEISSIKCDVPCRIGGDGCGGSCQIIKCAKDKKIEGCWECAEFETCSNFDSLKPFHGDAPLKNLQKIKELGIEYWARYRETCYPWL